MWDAEWPVSGRNRAGSRHRATAQLREVGRSCGDAAENGGGVVVDMTVR